MKQFTESEVTIKSLVEVFDAAFMKVMDEEEDSVRIQGEHLKLKLSLDENRKFLRWMILYSLSGNISFSEAALLANKVNDEYLLIRFAAYEYEGQVGMSSTYYLTFEEGLFAYQLIKITKKFEEWTVDGLREYFNDYL